MTNALRGRLRRLEFILDVYPALGADLRATIREEMHAVVRLLLDEDADGSGLDEAASPAPERAPTRRRSSRRRPPRRGDGRRP